MNEKPKDVTTYNRRMWDAQVKAGNRWTIPVSPEEGDCMILQIRDRGKDIGKANAVGDHIKRKDPQREAIG